MADFEQEIADESGPIPSDGNVVSFPSIEQFRNVIRHVNQRTVYTGRDAEGEPLFDHTRPLPTLRFHGTVKLHGTNAALCRNNGILRVQSRNRIITPTEDHAGFALYALKNEAKIAHLFAKLPSGTVAVFGEWCGCGIQKGVAINQLPKQFIVFAIKADERWLTRQEVKDACLSAVFPCIEDYPTFDLSIDFAKPEQAQAELVRITEEVEAQCPVAHRHGVDGIGEGVVWYCTDPDWQNDASGMWFKVKGEKHSVTKVRTLAAVDVEKVNSVRECVDKICTENRMAQGIDKLREDGTEPDIRCTGMFLKWLATDCVKEELDTIVESGLEPNDVRKAISAKGRIWFMSFLEQEFRNAAQPG